MDSRPLTLSSESKEDKLPDPLVPIYGFLEPYKIIRNNNGITAVFKADVCDEIIKKIKIAHSEKSYEKWEEVLEKLDYHIEIGRSYIPAGVAISSPLESIIYLSKKIAKYTNIIDEKHAFLIALLNTRTYICMELRAHNKRWQNAIENEYEQAHLLHNKIINAKIETPSRVSDEEIQKWVRDRNANLEILAKKYHIPSIVFAMTSCQLFLNEKEILPIPKSNRHIPEHFQPDFYERGYEYSTPVFRGILKKANPSLKEIVDHIHSKYKLDEDKKLESPPTSKASVQDIQQMLGIPSSSAVEVKRQESAQSAAGVEGGKSSRVIAEEDIRLLSASGSEELIKIRELLQLEKDKNVSQAKSIYDPAVLAKLSEEVWQKLVRITVILKTQQQTSLSKTEGVQTPAHITAKP